MIGSQDIGILIADHLVIGGDNHSALGVVGPRQLIKRNLAGPVVCAVPSRHRPSSVALSADGYRPGRLIPDIAVSVGIHQVLRWHPEEFGRRLELLPIASRVQRKYR